MLRSVSVNDLIYEPLPYFWRCSSRSSHTDKATISTLSPQSAMSAPQRNTAKDVYGPGTFVDTELHSVPDESQRLLRLLACKTPGFTQDEAALSDVEFSGDDLSIIPGPLKSQALVRNRPPYTKTYLRLIRTGRRFARNDRHRRQRNPSTEEHRHRRHQHRHRQSGSLSSNRSSCGG
jgi:hypothetical protein